MKESGSKKIICRRMHRNEGNLAGVELCTWQVFEGT